MNDEDEGSRVMPPGVADERFALARLRTHLALDRTLLAWIRTTLSMVGFGFGLVAFFRSLRLAHPGEPTEPHHLTAIGFGVGLLVLGLVMMVLASVSYRADVERLLHGQAPVLRQRWLSLAVVLILTLLAVSGLVTLMVL
jgi:putative membrane protein